MTLTINGVPLSNPPDWVLEYNGRKSLTGTVADDAAGWRFARAVRSGFRSGVTDPVPVSYKGAWGGGFARRFPVQLYSGETLVMAAISDAYTVGNGVLLADFCCVKTWPAPPEPVVFVDWTWSETDENGDVYQTVQAYPEIGQAGGIMNRGSGISDDPWYRSGVAGNALPILTTGQKRLPCTEGVPISFSCIIGSRISSGNATLSIAWSTGASVTLHPTGTLTGPTPYLPISATLTPPAGATWWQIFIIGTIDNVRAAL
jgi:hypothetical protein